MLSEPLWSNHSMNIQPLRTTVIGSYPFPGWLEFACQHLGQFGDAHRVGWERWKILSG